nr:hypothetical protein L203_00574 [Cryptococcus depauperatus CBS 7841]
MRHGFGLEHQADSAALVLSMTCTSRRARLVFDLGRNVGCSGDKVERWQETDWMAWELVIGYMEVNAGCTTLAVFHHGYVPRRALQSEYVCRLSIRCFPPVRLIFVACYSTISGVL